MAGCGGGFTMDTGTFNQMVQFYQIELGKGIWGRMKDTRGWNDNRMIVNKG